MKHWLDPDNSGVTVINGNEPHSAVVTDILTLNNFGENDSAALYLANEGGYLAGNNVYGDLAKAEYYDSTSYNYRNVIQGIYIYFGVATGSQSNIVFSIWDDNNGTPGEQIASVTKPISSIVADVTNRQYTYVEFATPVTIPGPFYAGVVLPQIADDTLAIVTNTVGDTQINTAWEENSAEQWFPYDSDNSWGISLNHAIWPVVGYVATSVDNLPEKKNPYVKVYPNPTSSNIFVDLSNLENDAELYVYNNFGVLINKYNRNKTNSNLVKIDFTEHPAGLYLIQIITQDSKIVKKVLIVK